MKISQTEKNAWKTLLRLIELNILYVFKINKDIIAKSITKTSNQPWENLKYSNYQSVAGTTLWFQAALH